MLALASVWIAFASLVLAGTMLLDRPAFTDLGVVLVLWVDAPLAMCLGGLVLWAHRKDTSPEPAVVAQRTQAKVAIGLAVVAAAIVYGLINFSHKLVPVEG